MMGIVEIFNTIRDIPYKIPLTLNDAAIDCLGKHRKLLEDLAKAGDQVRLRKCSFLWSEQNIPKEILDIPHQDECEHLFLEIYLDSQWLVLDATWDIGLKNIFKINHWDGKSNTEIAVKPIEIYPYVKDINLSHCESDQAVLEDIRINGDFYKAFNNWLEDNRVGL
ncbi:MAG: hypothetical protein WCT11_03520 [Candidatus Magasanikbacteria bacterium]